MKNILTTIFILLSFINGYSQDNAKEIISSCLKKKKGYLWFSLKNFGEVIFFASEKINSRSVLKQVKRIKGLQLRGQDTYSMYKAKQDADVYIIYVRYRNVDRDSSYVVETKIGIIPVELTYREYHSGFPDTESGTTFKYNCKEYTIRYIDDWDVY